MRRRFANGALAILLTADACGSELVYVLRTKYVSASIRNHDGPRGLLAAHVATEHGFWAPPQLESKQLRKVRPIVNKQGLQKTLSFFMGWGLLGRRPPKTRRALFVKLQRPALWDSDGAE